MDLRAMGAERLCNAVADPAGAADHQNLLAAKIQFVHRQPRIWFYAENITANIPGKKPMSDFKQLSRSVKGLTVLVTGAASGMGRATARVFAAEGANVAVTDINPEATQAVAGEIAANGGAAKAWTLDVANSDNITTVVNDVAAHFGGLDIVVNNGGSPVRLAIDDDNYDDAWAKGLAVMLTAHQRIIRTALPYLRKSKSPRIVNIASTE